jgi:WD40 repeat protein
MNFEAVQKHCMEIYESALVWIPQNSLIRKTYTAGVSRVPRVIAGLSDSWGPVELIMQNGSEVESVAFSQDGSRVVSGSEDKIIRIWNVMTGEVEAELKGHTARLMSVAFSQDGSQVFSGSGDNMFRIWNVMTGEVEAELKSHGNSVEFTFISSAFSQDGSRVVSKSVLDNKRVQIRNVTMGEVEAELKGHTGRVVSVAFSQDGSRVVSGSGDKTVRIWNVMTGKVEAELKGHTDWVRSVAFSQDGSRVVSGSDDKTVRIWNVTTGKVEAKLKGHTDSGDVCRILAGQQPSRLWIDRQNGPNLECDDRQGRG